MHARGLQLTVICAALALACGCITSESPGDVLASMRFTAQVIDAGWKLNDGGAFCYASLEDEPIFNFRGTFSTTTSAEDGGLVAFYTPERGLPRESTYQHPLISVEAESNRRVFTECGCNTAVKERFELTLLPGLGDDFPEECWRTFAEVAPYAFDGGDGRVDRACGRLTDVIRPAPLEDEVCQPECRECTVIYEVTGKRR
jgi:hypothetical protein